jgi:hypothetical protein
MKTLKLIHLSRSLIFGLITVILGASVLYSRAIRKVSLTDDLQYIPKENTMLFTTGEIENLWRAVDGHFGGVIREPQGFLSSLVKKFRKHFDEEEVPINGLLDLTHYGLDLKQGAVLSLYRVPDEFSFVLVLHLQQEEPFIDFLARLTELVPDQKPMELIGDGKEHFQVITFQKGKRTQLYLAYPKPGVALISNSLDLLRRSLFNRKANLAYALESDNLYDAVRQRLRRPLLSGPTLFLFWQHPIVPPISQVVGVVSLSTDIIRLEVELKFIRVGTRVLSDLLAPSPPEVPWQRYFSRETAAIFVLQDWAIPRYLHFLSAFGELGRAMYESYEGILGELREVPKLRRLVLAVTGYRSGLPEITLGIWGDPVVLEQLVDDLQVRLRKKRDQAVVKGALEAFAQTQERPYGSIPLIAALQERGFIKEDLAWLMALATPAPWERGNSTSAPETRGMRGRWRPAACPQVADAVVEAVEEIYSLFERYSLTNGEAHDAELRREDFQNSIYQRRYKNSTMKYLVPRITENDLLYRPKLQGVDPDTLFNDRYRLVAVVLDDILWVATNTRDLEALLDWAQDAAGTLPRSFTFRAASSRWSGKEKIQGFLNMDQIIALGLLSSESQVEEVVKGYLLDLRHHPALSLDLKVKDRGNRMWLSGNILSRPRLESR